MEIPGMTREDAVTYLTSLEGRVSMVVQYKREGQCEIPQRVNLKLLCLASREAEIIIYVEL